MKSVCKSGLRSVGVVVSFALAFFWIGVTSAQSGTAPVLQERWGGPLLQPGSVALYDRTDWYAPDIKALNTMDPIQDAVVDAQRGTRFFVGRVDDEIPDLITPGIACEPRISLREKTRYLLFGPHPLLTADMVQSFDKYASAYNRTFLKKLGTGGRFAGCRASDLSLK